MIVSGDEAPEGPRPLIVWRDKVVATTICPVLLLSDDVRNALDIFDDTHEVESTISGARWKRHSLPGSGGVHDQDSLLREQVDHICNVEQQLIDERKRKPQKKAATDEGKEQRRARTSQQKKRDREKGQ